MPQIAAFLYALQDAAEIVRGTVEIHQASRDPKDNPVLACAVAGHAHYLVTDDRRDLFPLDPFRGVRIVSVPTFLRLLRSR